MSPFGTNPDIYQCDTKNLHVEETTVVSRVFGNHMEGKDNLDVERLHIDQQTCQFMPRGFETFFPNLKGIRIASSGLKVIGSVDLKPFPRLIAIDVPFNNIETVPGDIFEYNLKLNYIFFAKNKISNVGRDVLAPLKTSFSASFYGNICVDQNGDSSTGTIKALQDKLNSDCAATQDVNTVNSCY